MTPSPQAVAASLLTRQHQLFPVFSPQVLARVQRFGTLQAYTADDRLMASALLITLPPVLVVIVLQRWFVKGLVDSEK